MFRGDEETRRKKKPAVTGSEYLRDTGAAERQHKLSHNLEGRSGKDKGQVNQKTASYVDEMGVVDAFLLVQTSHRVSSPGVQVISNYRLVCFV